MFYISDMLFTFETRLLGDWGRKWRPNYELLAPPPLGKTKRGVGKKFLRQFLDWSLGAERTDRCTKLLSGGLINIRRGFICKNVTSTHIR